MLKKIWHDPVWSKVIAVGIIAIFTAVGSYLLGWFPIIGQWLVSDYGLILLCGGAAIGAVSYLGWWRLIGQWLVSYKRRMSLHLF
jgi:hypothetical protein